jgi:cyclopropane-fatty-acyl-phospholipid synthase
MLLARLCDALVRDGALTLIDAHGRTHRFGSPRRAPDVVVRLSDPGLHVKLATSPHLALGEAYMDGTLTVERGDIYDLLDLWARNLHRVGGHPLSRFERAFTRAVTFLQQYNPIRRARRNVAHHYDLSDVLYDHFLDYDRQYSCALFTDPRMTLEEAQDAKKRHIAGKLLLRPGQRVLDIGCGWGGLALYLADTEDVEVTGITLSAQQLAVARRRAAEAQLAGRVAFHLRDFREETGRYDRIVSVGMFEHVGRAHFGAFFSKITELLDEDGVALLHAIGRMDGPSATSPWLRKYIFPGSYIPALSEVLPAIERARLWVTDVEVLRLHYAETLRHWRRRFLSSWRQVAELYDERFCRMWEFYLAQAEAGFRRGGFMVFQVQLGKRIDAVPLTRDYLYEGHREAAREVEMAA